VLVSFSSLDNIPEQNTLVVERFFWLMASKISKHHGREDVALKLISWQPGSRERDACPGGLSPFPLFYSIWVPSLWDGAGHIQGGSELTKGRTLS
jgi:hypothetical protein